jgi:hypothetical protein
MNSAAVKPAATSSISLKNSKKNLEKGRIKARIFSINQGRGTSIKRKTFS